MENESNGRDSFSMETIFYSEVLCFVVFEGNHWVDSSESHYRSILYRSSILVFHPFLPNRNQCTSCARVLEEGREREKSEKKKKGKEYNRGAHDPSSQFRPRSRSNDLKLFCLHSASAVKLSSLDFEPSNILCIRDIRSVEDTSKSKRRRGWLEKEIVREDTSYPRQRFKSFHRSDYLSSSSQFTRENCRLVCRRHLESAKFHERDGIFEYDQVRTYLFY